MKGDPRGLDTYNDQWAEYEEEYRRQADDTPRYHVDIDLVDGGSPHSLSFEWTDDDAARPVWAQVRDAFIQGDLYTPLGHCQLLHIYVDGERVHTNPNYRDSHD